MDVTRAFIVRPFGTQDGIDFDRVEKDLIAPALKQAGIEGRTTLENAAIEPEVEAPDAPEAKAVPEVETAPEPDAAAVAEPDAASATEPEAAADETSSDSDETDKGADS